jgi:hypothetical protein
MENYVYDIDSLRGLNLALKIPFPLFAYIIDEAFKFTGVKENTFSV